MFPTDKVAVHGLHSVFEHHAAMTPISLNAFLQEFQDSFPVAVNKLRAGLPRSETRNFHIWQGFDIGDMVDLPYFYGSQPRAWAAVPNHRSEGPVMADQCPLSASPIS